MLYFQPSRRATAIGQRILLGQLLIQRGVITDAQLADALQEQATSHEYLGEILIRRGVLSEAQLMQALSEQMDIPCVTLAHHPLDAQVVRMIPAALARRYVVMPLSVEGECLRVATADPFNTQALDELRALLGREIQPVLAGRQDLEAAIAHYYGPANPASRPEASGQLDNA